MIQSLKSEVREGVRTIRGVRFARAARFEESVLIDNLEQCELDPAPVAPQNPGTIETLLNTPPQPMSEDCLFLNIFTPEGASTGDHYPVLVWVHGGAYLNGSGATPWYDGSNLARHGAVVVTINYRLGALGFLGDKNWGIGDQINALKWVRSHIGHLGGDSNNVTVFGESAGGSGVLSLMAAPEASALIHRVIAMSPSIGQLRSREAAERMSQDFMAELGEDPGAATLEAILKAQLNVASKPGNGFTAFSPTNGGSHLPANILDAVAKSEVPLMIGTTKDENRLFNAFDPVAVNVDREGAIARIAATFKDRAAEVYASYTAHHPDYTPPQVLSAIESDGSFRVPARRLANQRSLNNKSTFVYWFAVETTSFGGALGSCHAADIPFTFDNLRQPGVSFFLGEIENAEAVAGWFSQKILTFARGNEPWMPYRHDDKVIMKVDADPSVLVAHESELLALWD